MKTFFILQIVALFLSFSMSHAANGIPSFGLETALAFRSALPDSAFRLPISEGTLVETDDFTTRSLTLGAFPILGAIDVQSQVTEVIVQPGSSFLRHSHPRSSEILYIVEGTFRVEIVFEGTSPRVVEVNVSAGEVTVFPQGLVHQVFCISDEKCKYIAVFTSADAGFVAA